MEFTIIDFEDVQRDLDTGVTTNFNTNFHSAEDAPGYPIPSHAPYAFDKWLPLILRSRNLPSSDLQVITLSRAQTRVVLSAAAASIHTRVINRAYEEDLQEEVYPAFDKLVFPPEGLFMRFAACSAKDGVQKTPGKVSVHSVDEIILQMTTSARAWSALGNIMNHEDEKAPIYFLPFDAKIKVDREYRIFCAPESLRITAVSQYRWHKPWMFSGGSEQQMKQQAEKILDGIKTVHGSIISELQEPGNNELDDLLRKQGFTFDVIFFEDTGVSALIELNTFGVTSACGSCLFQWLNDVEVLYGKASDDVEFRVVAAS
ncbi:hypothetical protein PT974_10901 [Cladobotryum mycophilum]|uniref:Cell division cycle protein 123 n=1 Tax=Cladobotryum mycophilum TaxID=491253 RepID=A0ABR0SB45_9HYPO